MMDEATFDRVASQELSALEAALRNVDGVDADLADGILRLELDDEGPDIVVNSHAAARQIRVAANLAAAHFSYDEKTGRWFDTKSGTELRAHLSAQLAQRLAHPVKL
jgi:iron donor protein CyaY